MSENILHVYGQQCQHDEVIIAGTKDALLHLAEVLKSCAENNVPSYIDSFTGDGEGFHLLIRPSTKEELETVACPYFGQTSQDKNPQRVANYDKMCSSLYNVISKNIAVRGPVDA